VLRSLRIKSTERGGVKDDSSLDREGASQRGWARWTRRQEAHRLRVGGSLGKNFFAEKERMN